jgi:hypothetical protein
MQQQIGAVHTTGDPWGRVAANTTSVRVSIRATIVSRIRWTAGIERRCGPIP